MEIGEVHHLRWFHPGRDPERGVPGSYKVDDAGRIEVRLYENWDDQGSLALMPAEDFPTILYGEVFREAVTLVGCRDLGGKTTVTSQQDVRIGVDYGVEGFVYLSEDELALTEVRFCFTDQEAWTGWSPHQVEQSRGANGLERASVRFERPPDLEVGVDGGLLQLQDDSYLHEDSVTRRTTLQIRSRFAYRFDEPVPIPEIMTRYAYPLQILLLTATGNMPGAMSIVGTNPAWFAHGKPATVHSEWVSIRRYHGGPRGLAPGSLRYLHLLDDFDFVAQLPQVLEAVARHRLAFERYAEMLSEHSVGDLSRFVAMTRVIDAFDRSRHPDKKRTGRFKEPVMRLDDEAGGFVGRLVGRVPDWGFYIAELRNVVLHGVERTRDLVPDPRPLFAATEALELLFEMHVLVEFGFTVERAAALVERRHPFWARRKTIDECFPVLVGFVGRDSRAGPREGASPSACAPVEGVASDGGGVTPSG
ncbi:HEPN domain-containing protein [Cellulomonas sp. KRMCY2]|uniref:ApeA N-terminal domain 1-containing protein n=1 Tax=Cellulomonas sp. KRMCY2 TaxID=1304865 RepID=UPI00045EC151|nr:HEPN domain-containing protein [Cellulomonas sp. KRMCY2]